MKWSFAIKGSIWALFALCILLLSTATSVVAQQHPTLVSVNASGTGSGSAASGLSVDTVRYRITPNGRYVLFFSEAGDLVSPASIGAADIFVRDLQSGTTELVSVKLPNTSSGGVSKFGLISDNGRYVAFTSVAPNIVANDTNSSSDVFIRDMQLGVTRLVSVNAAGTASGALGGSELIDMSPDGRFIVFSSMATNLTAQTDNNGFGSDIYVRDTVNNVTKLVSVNTAGTATGNGTSAGAASITADGRYVVFGSQASDLIPNDTTTRDIFLRDLQAGTTIRLSTNTAGTAGGDNGSDGALIDRGGRFVVFDTRAANLSSLPDTNSISDIFIYDIQPGTRKLITVNAAGNAAGSGIGFSFSNQGVQYSISGDGRFVVFTSQSADLVANDTNGGAPDIFRYDVATQAKSLVSVNKVGTSGSSQFGSSSPSISADGRLVAFHSFAADLVNVADEPSGATNDVFVRDMQTGQTSLASINSAGTRTGNGFSLQPLISADGSRLVFNSRADDLITNDVNGVREDVFVFATGITNSPPALLLGDDAVHAMALDSVTQALGPFTLASSVNWGGDGGTRVSLFVSGLNLLPGDNASSLVVTGEDEQGTIHTLPVEHMGALPDADNVTQIIVKLPQVSVPVELTVRVSLRGTLTNKGYVRVVAP